MTLPVSPEDFHDAMVESGHAALVKLEASYRPTEPRILPDVTAVSHVEKQLEDGRTKQFRTEHRVQVLPDISPDILFKSFVPPEYLLATFCSLSVALASHLSDKRPGMMPIFPPGDSWLRDHVSSLWMRMPAAAEVEDVPIYEAGTNIHDVTELVMERAEGQLWSVNYRRSVTTLLMRLDDTPGKITEV